MQTQKQGPQISLDLSDCSPKLSEADVVNKAGTVRAIISRIDLGNDQLKSDIIDQLDCVIFHLEKN